MTTIPVLTDSMIRSGASAESYRKQRYEEYLNLADAAGQARLYVTMLARLDRVSEAVTAGLQLLNSANDVHGVARILADRGAPGPALRLAQHGLSLGQSQVVSASPGVPDFLTVYALADLADWVTTLAQQQGDRDLAFDAALVSQRARPSLPRYRLVQSLAGAAWVGLRDELLERLRQKSQTLFEPSEQVAIFLYEGLIDDAIRTVTNDAYWELLRTVADAAIPVRPDWVIQVATRQAEAIIRPGSSQHYDRAVEWLERVRDAYRAAGRDAAWQEYVGRLRLEQSRKYKLMALMKEL